MTTNTINIGNTRKTKCKSFEELYSLTDSIIKEYKKEGLTELQKDSLIMELLEHTKGLVIKNCCSVKYGKGGLYEYEVDDLYNEAIGEPLVKALKSFKPDTGVYFMQWWFIHYMGHFKHMTRKQSSVTEKLNSNSLRLDKEIVTDGGDNVGVIELEDEQASKQFDILENNEGLSNMMKLLAEYEGKSARAWAIRAELEGTYDFSTSANRERLRKAKKGFQKFLLEKGALTEKWFEGREKSRRTKNKKNLL